MKLNCDLGESFGQWQLQDDELMPYIDQANIACGFHAGDPLVMQRTLKLAKQHGLCVGAHPSYPDLMGFGRRSMQCTKAELIAMLHYQCATLEGMAKCEGLQLSYVKPHGALYNDMMGSVEVRHAIFKAISSYHRVLPLMIQSTVNNQRYQQEAQEFGVTLWFEAFADRGYNDDGSLVSRNHTGALLDDKQALKQVKQLLTNGYVTSIDGQNVSLSADTICVHGDNPHALSTLKKIRALLETVHQ